MSDNEFIAGFMGIFFDESGKCTDPEQKYSWRPGCYDQLSVHHLQYADSWNWIMPVVHQVDKYRLTYPNEVSKVCDCKISIDLQHIYTKVVEFTKWYALQRSKES